MFFRIGLFIFLDIVSIIGCFKEMSLDLIFFIIICTIFALIFYAAGTYNYDTYKDLRD